MRFLGVTAAALLLVLACFAVGGAYTAAHGPAMDTGERVVAATRAGSVTSTGAGAGAGAGAAAAAFAAGASAARVHASPPAAFARFGSGATGGQVSGLQYFRQSRAPHTAAGWIFEAVRPKPAATEPQRSHGGGRPYMVSDVLRMWLLQYTRDTSPSAAVLAAAAAAEAGTAAATDASYREALAFTREFMCILAGTSDCSGRAGSSSSSVAPPTDGVYWETPPVSRDTISHTAFRFALLPSTSLSRAGVDPHTFSKHCAAAQRESSGGATAATFSSLGRDAVLVAPCPVPGVDTVAHAHLAAFMRATALPTPVAATAPTELGRDSAGRLLWAHVAAAALNTLQRRGAAERTWLSTSGDGVAWLHVRLDTRPKYYQYRPFRTAELEPPPPK